MENNLSQLCYGRNEKLCDLQDNGSVSGAFRTTINKPPNLRSFVEILINMNMVRTNLDLYAASQS